MSLDFQGVVSHRDPTDDAPFLLLDTMDPGPSCGPDCRTHLDSWQRWFTLNYVGAPASGPLADAPDVGVANEFLAVLLIPKGIEAYLKDLGSNKSRHFRKAMINGCAARPFNAADHLDEIYRINTSKTERQGQPMTARYLEYPLASDFPQITYCPVHAARNMGCFRGGELLAYATFAVVGEFSSIVSLLGHGRYLSSGVMYALVQGIVEDLIRHFPYAVAFNYRSFTSSGAGLAQFKRTVGMRPYTVALRGSNVRGPEMVLSGLHVVNTRKFDKDYFKGKILVGTVPRVRDHRNWGLRAILNHLKTPECARILDIADHGAGNTAGEATTAHILRRFSTNITVIERDQHIARLLEHKFGARIDVHVGELPSCDPGGRFDLIVVGLHTGLIGRVHTEYLDKLAEMLVPGGKLITAVIYDCAEIYDGERSLLNPAGRRAQQSFVDGFFGIDPVTLEAAQRALWPRGFAALGLVDKWMGVGKAKGIGWLYLERI